MASDVKEMLDVLYVVKQHMNNANVIGSKTKDKELQILFHYINQTIEDVDWYIKRCETILWER